MVAAWAITTTDRMRDGIAQAGMDPRELAALTLVATHDGCSLNWLHRRTGLTQSGTVRLVDRLSGKQRIRRGSSTGRGVPLHLTETGQQHLREWQDRPDPHRGRAAGRADAGPTGHPWPAWPRPWLPRNPARPEADATCRTCTWDACRPECPVDRSVRGADHRAITETTARGRRGADLAPPPRLPPAVWAASGVALLASSADTYVLFVLLWIAGPQGWSGGQTALLVLAPRLPTLVSGPLVGRTVALMAMSGRGETLPLLPVLVLGELAGSLSPATYAAVRSLMPRLVTGRQLGRANAAVALSDQLPLLLGAALVGPSLILFSVRLGACWSRWRCCWSVSP